MYRKGKLLSFTDQRRGVCIVVGPVGIFYKR
jgi:hypothetical protein